MNQTLFKYTKVFCEKFDFSIIRMKGKKPIESKIRSWFNADRSIEELKNLEWNYDFLTGIAVIINKNLVVIDFDKVKDITIVYTFLEDMGLSSNYKWLVKSGSGEGYHVYVFVKNKEELLKKLGHNVVYFYPQNKDILDHIEVRIRNCYIVLPPSTHPVTNKEYEFVNGEPTEKPRLIDEQRLIDFLDKYFEPIEKKEIKEIKEIKEKDAESSSDTKHLNKAIDFIKKEKFDYKTWNKLGFTLASLGEKGRDYFFRLSKNEFWETPDEIINEEFNNCLNTYDPNRSNLGTIFQYAKDRGFKFSNKRNGFSGVFFEFKLCLLQLPEERMLIRIMHYAMFRKAFEEIGLKRKKEIEKFFIEDFQMKFKKEQYQNALKDYKELKKFSDEFESRNEPDVYCRIGKEFFNDVLNKKYTMNDFRLLCALYGIIGKVDPLKPIGKNRIKYAMLGFKDEKTGDKEGINKNNLVSDTALKNGLKKLQGKSFFRKVYYSKWAFYSTRLTKEELIEGACKWLEERKRKYLKALENNLFKENVKNRLIKVEEEFNKKPNKTLKFIKMNVGSSPQK